MCLSVPNGGHILWYTHKMRTKHADPQDFVIPLSDKIYETQEHTTQ